MDPTATVPAVAAVIFDFDGLLMDTESTMFESWRFEWGQWGLELDPSGFFANHGGDVTEERYRALATAVGRRYDRALSQARRIEYRDRLHQTLDLRPGLRDWILAGQRSGLQLAIASSSPRPWLDSHLGRAGLMDEFGVIASGDEVSEHKPDPAVYRLALGRLGTAPEQTVAVEDTAHGVRAAQAAGLACIAIPNPFVALDAVAGADLVLASAEAMSLPDALEQSQRGRAQRMRRGGF